MAEIGNEFPIQNQALSISGLSESRRSNRVEPTEEEPNNRVDEAPSTGDPVELSGGSQGTPGNIERETLRQAENSDAGPIENPNDPSVSAGLVNVVDSAGETEVDSATGDLVNVQANGQVFEVPSQDVQENLDINRQFIEEPGRSVADLNESAQELASEPEGRGPVGAIENRGGPPDPNLGEINAQIAEEAQGEVASLNSTTQNLSSQQPLQNDQESAQDRTVQRLVEEVVDDGRGPGLEAQAPDNPIFDTPSQLALVNDTAGTTGSTTGLSDPDSESVEQAAREASRVRDERQDQENAPREAESVQTERGQNVNRLI